MKLQQIALIALAFSAISCTSKTDCTKDASKDYILDTSSYKTLISPEGKEIALLDDSFESLYSISEYKGKLIAMGETDFGEMTAIIDPKEGLMVDSFIHYYLSNPWGDKKTALQSPSGRYLIYRKFHAPFEPEISTSNFAMIYDLEKSPAENRVKLESSCGANDSCADEGEVLIGRVNAGLFLFPANKDLECSTCSPYKTEYVEDEQYLYIMGNKWDAPKTVLQLSYTKAEITEFLILEETAEGISQKILKFEEAKLFDKNGKELEYDSTLEKDFYMVDFQIEGDTLTITALADYSEVAKMIFKL